MQNRTTGRNRYICITIKYHIYSATTKTLAGLPWSVGIQHKVVRSYQLLRHNAITWENLMTAIITFETTDTNGEDAPPIFFPKCSLVSQYYTIG